MDSFKLTFTFGKNWRRFLKSYTPERQKVAQEALLKFLGVKTLEGKTFLDIGSGSGIHSAAAFLAGAKRIHSFDYDPDSVAATRYLHKKFGSPAHWTIEQASVLDDAYMKQLGTFDIIYSWGVLHHTGSQWHAIENAAKCMGPDSCLFIALYAKEAYPNWDYWLDIKRRYNEAGPVGKFVMELQPIWQHMMHRRWSKLGEVLSLMFGYRNFRGMAFWSDIRDWLGGWPTEFSSVKEVAEFARDKFGLVFVNLGFGEGNTEFLFMKKEAALAQGFRVYDERDLFCYLRDFTDEMIKEFTQPVWIFGAAAGGKVVYDFLTANKIPVAGFIDIEPKQDTLFGLPVVAYDVFSKKEELGVPVILASKYVSPNWARLNQTGFNNVVNAFAWIQDRMVRGLA